MKWYEHSIDDVEKKMQTNGSSGLLENIAKKRLEKHGYNALNEAEKTSPLLMFLAQFRDFMVMVLLAATLISGLLGEYIDAIAILLIVFLNGILGFIQEFKAEKSLQALKELSAPKVRVMRDGVWKDIPSKEVVVGDVVSISSGDRIGADLRLIEVKGLYIEESALTGESVPVQKHSRPLTGADLTLGDQENMAFMGTMAVKGSGVGIVVSTGMNTEMGKIADLIQKTETMATPLQRKLEELGKILIAVSLVLTSLVVVVGVWKGHDLYSMFLAGVSLAVAAIPEGLPAIVTVALAMGVQKMIKRKAVIRKLPAVETLGCATVICSDKTGTLTQNKMMVTHLWSEGKEWQVSGSGYEPIGEFYDEDRAIQVEQYKSLQQLLTFGLLCSHAVIREEKTKKGSRYILDGDPTEGALVTAAMKAGIHPKLRTSDFQIIKEFPFDSNRKMMSIVIEDQSGQRYIVVKGAPDVVLANSNRILWNNKQTPMTASLEKQVREATEGLASQALRTIAVAYKPLRSSQIPNHENDAEANLTFIGLQGMIDPPRAEVQQAIRNCHEAGIKTVMITGDHLTTAKAIARDLTILPKEGQTLDGHALSTMSTSELEKVVNDVYVYARVSPEHKLKIVKALQANGHIVAMTGDGINDAPAIKAANIGIAMGITGTDVTKEASSLVLSDDNFTTIRAAIEEGRNIYENIRKFIRYLLASNVGEILVMLFAMLMALPLPLVPIQILWVNLVTDGLPAMALGLDPAEGNVMKRPPRRPDEGVFARGMAWKIISRGLLIGIVTVIGFAYTLQYEELLKAQTVAFSILVCAQLIHVFDCRSERSIFHRNPFENFYLVLAVLSSLLLLIVVIYYPPLQTIFHTTPLSIREWIFISALSAFPMVALAGFTFLTKK
ncbi:calcium-translocating P-type ATPase, SERCA-type [Bacillus taeanensis]|uniref:P-type Ca(2+) transporter n=1 Tax=Bacillus taeanensis TaxID=273032 RepID=A0A366XMB4_9BACI|nr:calcium-translocating P-type ATPase, SERCA-type [Bacillus taeanensis]RBW67500.1 calcium-translocating P-type ATPase, SERCA-type [Bacillus taeanensis]